MSQKIFSQDADSVAKQFTNVAENWVLYDTILIGTYASSLGYNNGYFQNWAALAAASEVSFFNVRNRAHGLPYNNQDTRDQLPFVLEIYSIGISFWAPSTTTYGTTVTTTPTGSSTISNMIFESEIPKHCSLVLKTNQDERLITNSCMAPPGYGPVVSGLAQGDTDTAAGFDYPSLHHGSQNQGEAHLTNKWGFPVPLKIPRTASLSVVLRLGAYAQYLLGTMVGPLLQPLRAVANDTSYYAASGQCGIQVTIGGRRQVQQRGQYHA